MRKSNSESWTNYSSSLAVNMAWNVKRKSRKASVKHRDITMYRQIENYYSQLL